MDDNIKALKKFVDEINKNMKQEDYTEESWAQFETVLNDVDKQINKQYINLVTAYLNLRLKPNKNMLK